MAITQYRSTMRPGIEGALADMTPATLISREVQDTAGIGFGKAVFQGTAADQVTATATADKFVGFTVRDNAVIGIGDTGNGFRQRDSARVATHGALWATALVAVAARDKVYVVVASGALTNAAGSAPSNVECPGWQWDTATSGANQLARIRRV